MILGDLILQSGGISNRRRMLKQRFLEYQMIKKTHKFFLEFLGNFETFLDNKNSSVNFCSKKQ